MTPESITSLVKVRKALKKAPSEHTPLFLSLVDNGRNYPLSVRPAIRLAFGQNEGDFPVLGKKISPFHSSKLPSLADLQDLLIGDLQAARRPQQHSDTSFHQSAEHAKADGHDEQLDLLNSLTDGKQTTSGTVLGFPSPSLDDICGDAKVEYDNVLRESMTMAAVLPAKTLLSLQHSNEGTTFTSLLSGSVAWIIWPPTAQNLDILQNSYETFSQGHDDTKTNACSHLQGGVCLVQSTGEAIRLPPFCPMLCLSLETSILATHSVVTADQLANVLGKLPLLLAWFKTEFDGERKKTEFVTALLPHLSIILQGSFEETDLKKCRYPYSEEGPLHFLLHNWDGIKHIVAGMLNPSEAELVITMWDTFLRQARGRQCWLCGVVIRNKPKEMRKHFETKHWSTEKPAENEEQELQPQDQPQSTKDDVVTSSPDPEEASEEMFHDAVEIIEPQVELTETCVGKDVTERSILETMEKAEDDDAMELDE